MHLVNTIVIKMLTVIMKILVATAVIVQLLLSLWVSELSWARFSLRYLSGATQKYCWPPEVFSTAGIIMHYLMFGGSSRLPVNNGQLFHGMGL